MGATGVLARLLGATRSRFVFVVGKGGVGKSTTAGALALGLAEGGSRTHLVSTDPAHSLGDLFGRTLHPGATEASGCASELTLEELDGPGDAGRWLAGAAPALAELLDLGTYLEREDVRALLDRTFPGMDEVMAALRLAELAGRPEVARVVVDTAPTGHTLRLLDVGDVLGGWTRALGAMAAKASAVASPFAGRHVRFEGEGVVEDLRRKVAAFHGDVLSHAEVVVVTRPDPVVHAETERLVAALCARGLRPSAVVGIGARPDPGLGGPVRLTVPFLGDLRGCDGLRAWGGGASPRTARSLGERPAVLPAAPPSAPLDLFRGRELILFAGKGGVGKSTCAAACASALARERDVTLLGTDPAGSLGDLLGRPVDAEGTRIAPGLLARQLDAGRGLARFRERHRDRVAETFRRLGVDGRMELDRRVLESIVGLAPPGIDEVFALDALLARRADGDVLVVDTAPTGHFLNLVRMPDRALAWTRALLRLLLKYRSVLGLDDFAEDVLQFARRLKSLVELLQDPARAGVVVVTLTETLPRLETERLVAELELEAVPLLAVIENRQDAARPRTSGGAWPTGGRRDVRRIVAPDLDPSPAGPGRLLDFASRWTTA